MRVLSRPRAIIDMVGSSKVNERQVWLKCLALDLIWLQLLILTAKSGIAWTMVRIMVKRLVCLSFIWSNSWTQKFLVGRLIRSSCLIMLRLILLPKSWKLWLVSTCRSYIRPRTASQAFQWNFSSPPSSRVSSTLIVFGLVKSKFSLVIILALILGHYWYS